MEIYFGKRERQRFGWRVAAPGLGWRVRHLRVSGLGCSGIGYGSSGTGTGAGPEPDPGAELLNLGPGGRDLGPENGLTSTRAARGAAPTLRRFGGGGGVRGSGHGKKILGGGGDGGRR